MANDSECSYYITSFIDSSAADQISAYCINGSYIYFPPAWINLAYSASVNLSFTLNYTQFLMPNVLSVEYQAGGWILTEYNNATSIYQNGNETVWTAWGDSECSYNLTGSYLLVAECYNGSLIVY